MKTEIGRGKRAHDQDAHIVMRPATAFILGLEDGGAV
jgi:hypothetical protein